MIVTLCAGGLVAGESTLLLIGMNVPRATAWSTPRNLILAASDIVLGALMASLALFSPAPLGWAFYAAAGVLLATHLYREGEFLAGRSLAFAGSTALFVFNNVRLGLLAGSVVMAALR